MRVPRLAAFAIICLAFLAVPAFADGFIKVGNIRGSATDAQHLGWMPVAAWGTENRPANIFKFERAKKILWFEKKMDASSTALQKAFAEKTIFPQAVFDLTVRNETFRTTLFDVRLVAVETHGGGEKVLLQYARQQDKTFLPPR